MTHRSNLQEVRKPLPGSADLVGTDLVANNLGDTAPGGIFTRSFRQVCRWAKPVPCVGGLLALVEHMLRNEEGTLPRTKGVLPNEEGIQVQPNKKSVLPSEVVAIPEEQSMLPKLNEEGMVPDYGGKLSDGDLVADMMNRKILQEGREHLPVCLDLIRTVTNKSDDAVVKRTKLTKSLKLLCNFGKSIPHVGGIFTIIGSMLPTESKEAILLLQNLSEEIKTVRRDISELESSIKLEAVKLQYSKIVNKIEMGMDCLSQIAKSRDSKRIRHQERLKELCSNQAMSQAVKALLKGLAGSREGFSFDILQTVYDKTGKHRGQFELMCIRFLQLLSGGLAVISAYETMVRGVEAASDMRELFEADIEALRKRLEYFQESYQKSFRYNMHEDLNKVLSGKSTTKDAAAELSQIVRETYDWLETYHIICRRSKFSHYDFFGDHIQSYDCQKRFAVVFYRKSFEDPDCKNSTRPLLQQADYLHQVREVVRETDNTCRSSDFASMTTVLKDRLRSIGFSLWGYATVKAQNIPAVMGARRALDGLETFGEVPGAVVCEIGDRKHVCLVSPIGNE